MRPVTQDQAIREVRSEDNIRYTKQALGITQEPSLAELIEHYFKYNRVVHRYTVMKKEVSKDETA